MIRQQCKRIVAIQVCRVHFLSTKCTYQNYSVRSVSIIKEKQFFRNKVNESTHNIFFFFHRHLAPAFLVKITQLAFQIILKISITVIVALDMVDSSVKQVGWDIDRSPKTFTLSPWDIFFLIIYMKKLPSSYWLR